MTSDDSEGPAGPSRDEAEVRPIRPMGPSRVRTTVGPGAGVPTGRPAAVRGDGAAPARVPRRMPPAPPWSARSVVEDGGVTHELVSPVHPLTVGDRTGPAAGATCPTDVSVSVFDRPQVRRWVRGAPTIQVEGGSYPLAEAERLVAAIERLVRIARGESDEPGS